MLRRRDLEIKNVSYVHLYASDLPAHIKSIGRKGSQTDAHNCHIFLYTVKKVGDIPVSSRDVTYQILPGREKLNYSRLGRVWLVTYRLETGMSPTFFYNVAGIFQLRNTLMQRGKMYVTGRLG
jgi:hypothetical protein